VRCYIRLYLKEQLAEELLHIIHSGDFSLTSQMKEFGSEGLEVAAILYK
jgi:hypothetical protein